METTDKKEEEEEQEEEDDDQEPTPVVSRKALRDRLWTIVTDGKFKDLKKFFHIFRKSDIPLDDDNDEFDEDGGNVLMQCVKEGCDRGASSFGRDYIRCCRLLVEKGASTDDQDKAGRTPLHWAVFSKNVSFVNELLESGADPSIRDQDGMDPFHLSIIIGAKEIFHAIVRDREVEFLDHKDGKGVPPVVAAVQHRQIDFARRLLDLGVDINATDRRLKRTALHYAISSKRLDLYELLLKYKPEVDVADYQGKTVFHRVCGNKDPRYFQKLIETYNGIPEDVMDQAADDGMTPVIIACQNGNPEQLKELLDKGASASDADKTGKSALHYCADNLETQCAEMILHKDSDLLNSKDEQGFTPLHMAVIGGNAPLLRLLLKKDADINCLDNEHHTVAHWATVCGHLEVLEILLENGADVSRADSHEAFPIHYAAQMNGKENGHTDPKIGEKVLKKLVDNGVPTDVLDKDGRQPLLWAASAGNSESCKLLVKAGADINAIDKDGLSALHCAASRGHVKCIETLKNLGANVDLADKNNCTALFYAITLGNKECTKALLKFGSNPNHQDNRGRTPTHCAAIKGCVDTVKMLDKHTAQLWTPSVREDCPIHEAAQGGFCDVVKYLLKSKNDPAAVNLPNKGGRTCLHIAAIVNNLPLCKLLIDNGADKNATMFHKDKTYTPFDAAVVKGNQETAEYIKGKGGNSSTDLDKTGKRESKSAKSRRSVLTLESTPEEREKEEQAEHDKKGAVILTPVSTPSKGKKGGKLDKDKGGKDKEAEKKGKDQQKSDGEEDEDEDDVKDPGVKPLVAAGVGLKAKDKKGKEKEADNKKKTKGKTEEEKDSEKQQKTNQSEEEEKDIVDKTVPLGKAGVGAKKKGKGEKEEETEGEKDSEKQQKTSQSEEEEEEKDIVDKTVPLGKAGVGTKKKGKGEKEEETEGEEEEEESGRDNKDEEGKKSRKLSEQDDEAARIAAAAAAATAVKVKRRGSKEAGKKDSRGDSGVEADSERESSEEDGTNEEGKENSELPKGKTVQTPGGRVHRKKRRTDTVEEEEEEEEDGEGGKKDTAALAAAALLAEEEKKKKLKQEKSKEEQNEEKKKKETEDQKKKKESEKLKEEERKKKEADKLKEEERKKKEATEKLKEEERKKKEAGKLKEEKKKAEQLKEEERKKKEAAEKLKEEEKKRKETANRKGLRVATPQQGGKTGIEAQDNSHAPAAGAVGVGLRVDLAAGKDKKESAEVQKEEVGIQTDRKEEKEKAKTTDTGIQTKKQHTRQSGSQTEISGDQVASRESSLDRQPKSRVRTASKEAESEGEFEVPKGSPESEAEALRAAAEKRSVSRAESETNREEKPQSRQRVLQSPSKVPTDGRISQGLLTNSRKPSRQRTFERSDSPDLSSGEDIDERDYVDAEPKSRKQRAQNRLQNRTRKLRNRQVTGVYDPDRLSKPISVHKQKIDKKRLARERDSQYNGRIVEMDRSEEISDIEHSILRTRRGGGRCVNSIQESVRRYQSERRMVRQLHQLKRAQIYTGPMHDVVLFSKLMDVYRNNAPHDGDSTLDSQVLEDWEGYLRDQLQFVSHFYEDDRTGIRSASNTVRTRPSRSEKSANSAKRSVDNRYAELRFKEEFEMTEREAEREAMEDRMKEAAKKTDQSLKSVHSKTSDSLNEAKKVNDQFQNDFRRDVTERLKSGNSSKKERQWLIQESLSDEAQSHAEIAEKERREKYKEWHKKKNEELRRKLLKVYGPDQDYSDIKNSKTHSFKSSTPRIAYTSTPRPKSQITMTSGGMSQAQYGMDREITVQMTEYGMRRVKKDPDYPFDHSEANWTPKFDGSLRPRAGLVFVEPEVYCDALREEQQMKKAYSIAARSSANVTMDDERLLGPVSS